MSERPLRCAVYTRKSSEEGLDQAFNSLDAQREACVAYIASQVSVGWKLVPGIYDDGGISGGTLERPALQRLLCDIQQGRVDVIVVYKIDRLTRSLMDFAKLVDVFDKHSVSFVSVTQQFNTTTSMGRLTLNVLLSFAQFEREVTAERIRDKIAASKKKGMWMGGVVPLGYKVVNRKLVIDIEQAKIVRWFFRRYLELKSVPALIDELHPEHGPSAGDGFILDADSMVEIDGKRNDATATRTSTKGQMLDQEHPSPNCVPTLPDRKAFRYRGPVYALLRNVIYIGKISHKGTIHDGEHEGIIDQETFDAVQVLLAGQAASGRGSNNHSSNAMLVGLLSDGAGHRMMPSYTYNNGRRYPYYATDTRRPDARKAERWRIPARTLEQILLKALNRLLIDGREVARMIQQSTDPHTQHQLQRAASKVGSELLDLEPSLQQKIIQTLIASIKVETQQLSITINKRLLGDLLIAVQSQGSVGPAVQQNNAITKSSLARNKASASADDLTTFKQPVALKRRGVESRLVIPGHSNAAGTPDKTLIDAMAKAHLGLRHLTDGKGRSMIDAAANLKMDASDLSRIMPLAFLSPKVTEAILNGSIPPDMTLRKLTREIEIPLGWDDQERLILA